MELHLILTLVVLDRDILYWSVRNVGHLVDVTDICQTPISVDEFFTEAVHFFVGDVDGRVDFGSWNI